MPSARGRRLISRASSHDSLGSSPGTLTCAIALPCGWPLPLQAPSNPSSAQAALTHQAGSQCCLLHEVLPDSPCTGTLLPLNSRGILPTSLSWHSSPVLTLSWVVRAHAFISFLLPVEQVLETLGRLFPRPSSLCLTLKPRDGGEPKQKLDACSRTQRHHRETNVRANKAMTP